jgi:phosphate transport system ATP-binding protein
MTSGLEIRGLRVAYGGKEVLKGIDLDVEPGKITALIGPSGCGKTTLLRCINRLSELTRGCTVKGSIRLDGKDIREMDPMLLRRRVGMVFQKPNPFPMSIRENILYGIKAAKETVDEERVIQRSLERAAIWEEIRERLGDNAFRLSVGQQQRVCIARALAIAPTVVLMDEPAAALDPSSAARVEASIKAMKGDYTVVIVTHNMQQALRVSDYVAFIYLGELVEYGETEAVFKAPRNPVTSEYIAGRFG